MRNCLRYLTLMLCLMLTACGGSRDEPPQGQVSLLEKPAEAEAEEILLTVDGREVETWQYLYWLRQACETIAAEYEAVGMKPDWEQQTEDGTLAAYAKAQALSDAALYATVENWAKQYGCTAEATAGEAEVGLTAGQSAKLSQVGQLYGALYTLAFTPDSVLCPSEEEVEAFAEAIRKGDLTSGTGKKFDAVVVNGIGGSALGPQLLQFAINGPYWYLKSSKNCASL